MRNLLFGFFLISCFCFFTNCNSNKAKDERVLSVSIEPQKYFLDSIVGDKFSINTAIPAGANPESYDPSPAQMVDVGKSLIFFRIGNMGFENTWLHNISVNNKDLIIVDCSTGINPISHAGHYGSDPHIWSSPKTASIIAKNMYEEMVKYDQENKDYYKKRYDELEKKIFETDIIIKSYLDSAISRSFIIYHPALSYFADEYSLNQYSIEVDGKNPTPKQLAELIEIGKKENIKVVFLQEEYDEKNAEVIANELNARIVKINLLSYNWNEEMIKIAKAIAQVDDK